MRQYVEKPRGFTVSVLGQDKGYTAKYTPSAEGVPKGTPEGKGVLTVYTLSSLIPY